MIKIHVLAFLQGLTEFLPISSSGHLVLAQEWLSVSFEGVQLEVALHVATLFSILIYFAKDFVLILTNKQSSVQNISSWKWSILVSALVTGILALLVRDHIIKVFDNTMAVAIALISTGIIIFFTRYVNSSDSNPIKITVKLGVVFGLFQAISLIPGVSRSGLTISLLLFLGVPKKVAFQYSFLAVTPLLIIAACSELNMKLFDVYGILPIISAMTLACVVGVITLSLLEKVVRSFHFYKFGYYCIAIGVIELLRICFFVV